MIEGHVSPVPRNMVVLLRSRIFPNFCANLWRDSEFVSAS
jgi:hypothetical protein